MADRISFNPQTTIQADPEIAMSSIRGSYLLSENNSYCEPHKAITLVTAYLVERGLILKPEEIENKSNEMQRIRAERCRSPFGAVRRTLVRSQRLRTTGNAFRCAQYPN